MPFPPVDKADAVMFYEDPDEVNRWIRLPTRDDLRRGTSDPVTFSNGSVVEIHGKLIESITHENTTYFDDIGLPSRTIKVTFDGTTIPMNNVTGNGTDIIGPFWEHGNGTFEFDLNIEKPAGEYELVLNYDGDHMMIGVTYVTLINVNHPTSIDVDLSSGRLLPGAELEVMGRLTDDTGLPVANVPLQVWWEDRLLGPTAHGVYIDDFGVKGSGYMDDFENNTGNWSTYTASGVENQWERGTPLYLLGPTPHSWTNVWGTRLDSYYQRGAWSFLVSPVIDMSKERGYTLSFWAWWKLPSHDDMAYVVASTDYGETWDEGGRMPFTEAQSAPYEWEHVEFNVSGYSGSDHVRFAFVFISPAKTLDMREDGSFSYSHRVSNVSDVGRYDIRVAFPGDLHFQPSEDTVRVNVVRNTRIELEADIANTTGYRNKPMEIRGRLLDDRGEPLEVDIDGHHYFYTVYMRWPYEATIIWDPPFLRPPRVDPETGEFAIPYLVPPDHDLGPVIVMVRFSGDDFYNGYQVLEELHVKANLHVTVPSRENRTFHRGQAIDLGADLRIVPSESLEDRELGDIVTGVFVRVYWNGQLLPTRRTEGYGPDDTGFLIPSNHPLGEVNVTYEYDGNSTFEKFTQTIKYYVVSDTFIALEDRTVTKGDWVTIRGTITDDRSDPLAGVSVYIIWKRAPEIGRATSDGSGRFSLQYYIEYEDRVGNITVTALFKGDHVHMAAEGNATYTITSLTILERRDRTFNLVRGEMIQISARLYESWGGFRGREVQREMVTLTIDGIAMDSKRTAFDGSITFNIPMDEETLDRGLVNLVLAFNGTELYQASKNVTIVFIRVDQYTTISILTLNGKPFTPGLDNARPGDTVQGVVLVQNKTLEPWPWRNVSIYYRENNDVATEMLITEGITDKEGRFVFSLVLSGDEGGEVAFGVRSPGMTEAIWYTLPYITPPPPSDTRPFDVEGDRQVRAGSQLNLDLRVKDKKGWRADRLSFDLVTPPDGMTISSDGTVTWTPTDDQVGEHKVIVWLYDGERSETGILEVNVVKTPSLVETLVLSIAALIVVFVAALMFVIGVSRMARRRKRQ